MRRTQQSDIIENATDETGAGRHYGRNFKPLVAAGSWEISGFHYGSARCACCGRPIRHVLHLTNSSHDDAAKRDPSYAFPETIEIGAVCGPKVFLQSCIGFYTDPGREWDRQMKAWRGYIDYVILCVRNRDLWEMVPEELRLPIDAYLEDGYKLQVNGSGSGKWWIARDAKRRYLKSRKHADVMPDKRILYINGRTLVYAAKRLGLVPLHWELDDNMRIAKHEPLEQTA